MTSKPQRILSCVLCQERKIKCDRSTPCSQCVKANVQCVPASLAPRQRRRRFPERELLERIRHYEGLLQQNDIRFEPLHASGAKEDQKAGTSKPDARSKAPVVTRVRSASSEVDSRSETIYEAKDVWDTMHQLSRLSEDDDDEDEDEGSGQNGPKGVVMENLVKVAWDQFYESNDHLLFGSRKTNFELSTLHPPQVQIFRLWQIYLENVDTLLKVTHAPILQSQIIEAASDVTNIKPSLEALMFGIYCIAIGSLTEHECLAMFSSAKKDLLVGYHFACQQALARCDLLKTSERDCLTALYLYLISVRPNSDPRSLSSMLGVAIRIAQRMGIHSESSVAKHNLFEAEMRRRVWWALVLFDSRICEMADHKATMLNPTWDCRLPLNVNDSDLRPEMKALPIAHERPTDALFTIARARLLDFIRNSRFHLDFTNPALNVTAKPVTSDPNMEGDELAFLEHTLEAKYFKLCDDENPTHFMTVWTTRSFVAKNRLLEHYARYSRSSVQQTEAQRDAAFLHALRWLECDSKVMNSPLTKGFHWFANIFFPFPAYIHLVQDLKKRPHCLNAEQGWQVMSDNAASRSVDLTEDDNPFYRLFSGLMLDAWTVYEAYARRISKSIQMPKLVQNIKNKHANKIPDPPPSESGMPGGGDITSDDTALGMQLDFGNNGLPFDVSTGQAIMDFDMNTLDWSNMDPFWNPMDPSRW